MTEKHSFWSSIPGILTGIAAVISAITGLYLAMNTDNDAAESESMIAHSVEPPMVRERAPALQVAVRSEHESTDAVMPIAEPAKALRPIAKAIPNARQMLDAVDCEHTVFVAPNTVESLMSWSNHYFEQVSAAGGVRGRALDGCVKAISYRGQAYCKAGNDEGVRQSLQDVLMLCREAGVSLDDVLALAGPGTLGR